MPSASEIHSSPPPSSVSILKLAAAPFWLKVATFGFAFWAMAEASGFLSVPAGPYVNFWLPAGLYLTALLLSPPRRWGWILLAALVANLAFDLPRGTGFLTTLGFFCANTAEALTGVGLIRRFVARQPDVFCLRDFLGIVVYAAGCSTLAGALVGGVTLVTAGVSASFITSLITWWNGEAMAILLVTPFVLCWYSAPGRLRLPSRWKIAEAILLVGVLAGYSWQLLVSGQGIQSPCKFQLMPFLLWGGLRLGLRAAVTLNFAFALWLGFLTTHFLKGLTPAQAASGDYAGILQSFLAVSIIMTIIPAIVLNERNRKMRELQESETRFRVLTEASFEGVCVSENGRILDVNDQGLRMMGYRREEVIGRDIAECLPPAARLQPAENPRDGRENVAEYRIVRRDGTVFHAETRSKVVSLGDRVVRMTALRDITERIRTEEALRLSEDKFRSAMQNSPIGMALVAVDGRWLEVNPALCKLLGYSPVELLATNFQAITHPDDLADDQELVRQMLAGLIDSYTMEKRYLHKNGHVVWAQLYVSFVHNPDGSPRHFVSQIQDVSQRRLADETLLKNQAKLVLSMDLAKLVHWEYDVTAQRLACDENLFKYYGTTAVDQGGPTLLLEDYIRKFIHPKDAAMVRAEIDRAVATTDPHYCRQFEKRVCRADGSIAVMLTRLVIVKDAAGRTIKAYGVNQDITEQKQAEQKRKRLEEQLRQAQKLEALGTLAGGTAHEFNNMLGVISGYAELAKMELGPSHSVSGNLQEILKAGERAREIVQQILTFSRQQNQARQPVEIGLVIREAMKAVRNTLPPAVTLETRLADDHALILGNATQIHQVLMNICVNAWHALEGRAGAIRLVQETVTLADNAADLDPHLHAGAYVHVSIADNGAGMDAATLARIFEPFFTTKVQGQGTGLGLAVAHGIMRSHEGAIFAHSEPGRGATFHLYFPVSSEEVRSPIPGPTPPLHRGAGQRILLVDDEPSLTQVAAKFLRRFGYEATGVNSAANALDMVQHHTARFDLVITDFSMPGMNGAELAEVLNVVQPNLPVVLASGYPGAEAAERLGGPNIRSFLQKPYTADALALTVQAILSHEANGHAE